MIAESQQRRLARFALAAVVLLLFAFLTRAPALVYIVLIIGVVVLYRRRPATAAAPLAAADRTAILEGEIRRYLRRGYRVVSRSEAAAQLVRPKRMSFLLAVILLLLAVFPFVLYLLWYVAQRDKTVYVEVDEDGRVTRR